MRITFENKQNGRTVEVKGVKSFKTDDTCLEKKGYGVSYEDGTFSLYADDEWKLVMVEQ